MHANGASKNEENKNTIKIFSTANIIQVREKKFRGKGFNDSGRIIDMQISIHFRLR